MKKLLFILLLFFGTISFSQIDIEISSVKNKHEGYLNFEVSKYQNNIKDVYDKIYRNAELAFFREELSSALLNSGKFLRISNKKVSLFGKNEFTNRDNQVSRYGHLQRKDYLDNEKLFLPKTTISKRKLKSIELFQPSSDFDFSKYNVVLIKIENDPEGILTPYLSSFQDVDGYYFAINNFESDLIIVPYGKIVGKPITLTLSSSLKKYSTYLDIVKKKYGKEGSNNYAELVFFKDEVCKALKTSGDFLRINPNKLDLFVNNDKYRDNTLNQNELFKSELILDKFNLKSIEQFQPTADFDFSKYNVVLIKIENDPEGILTPYLSSFQDVDGYYFAINNFESDLIIVPFNPTETVNPEYSEFISAAKGNLRVLNEPLKLKSYYINLQAYIKLFEEFNIKGIPAVIDSFMIDYRGVVDSFALEVFHHIVITHHEKEYDLKMPLKRYSKWNFVPTPWLKNEYEEDNTDQYNDFVEFVNQYMPNNEKLPKHETGIQGDHQAFSVYPYNELTKRFQNVKKEQEELQKQEEVANDNEAKELKKLYAKYGKKYVDAAQNGDIIIGMHEELAYYVMTNRYTITSKSIGDVYKTFHLKSKVLSSVRAKVIIKNKKVLRTSTY